MKKIYTVLVLFSLANSAHAGFNALTQHSRANCVNNESISWDATTNYTLGTVSKHYHNGKWIHDVNTGWEYTWRSAAVHWGEAKPGSGWHVIGYHWIKYGNRQKLLEVTDVVNCSIYDGWWDIK